MKNAKQRQFSFIHCTNSPMAFFFIVLVIVIGDNNKAQLCEGTKANDRIHKGKQQTRKEWLVAVLDLVKEDCVEGMWKWLR